MMSSVYDIETRRRLAEELADAFREGGWDAEELAERGAGRLDRRPGWIDGLAAEIERWGRRRAFVVGGLSGAGQRALVAAIERHLLGTAESPGESPPALVRGSVPTFAGRWPVAVLQSVPELARRLELSNGQLAWLADVRGLEHGVAREGLRNYRYRWVARRRGTPRLIEAPKLRLKEIQRTILREILSPVPAHDAACGFVAGRSVLTHATHHSGEAALLALDLRDFFTSITVERVFGIFRAIGYPPSVAHVLTGLTTNAAATIALDALEIPDDPDLVAARAQLRRRLASPHLPQGAPTSPALANLASFGLDRRITAFAEALGLSYSRYADDIALSGPSLRRGIRARDVTATVAAIARSEGFALHRGKSVLRTAARRQMVTGVVVNAHPNVTREDHDRLRATLHRAARDGPGAVELPDQRPVDVRAHLNGRVAWVEALNPRRGARLRALYDAVDWDAG